MAKLIVNLKTIIYQSMNWKTCQLQFSSFDNKSLKHVGRQFGLARHRKSNMSNFPWLLHITCRFHTRLLCSLFSCLILRPWWSWWRCCPRSRRSKSEPNFTTGFRAVMWIRNRIIFAARIRINDVDPDLDLAKNLPKSWETRIKIDKNYQNIVFLKIEKTLMFNA